MKKRVFSLLLALALAPALFAGCGSGQEGVKDGADKLNIVCAAFSEYDWTRTVLGELSDGASVTYLFGNGADMHSYQPSTKDIVAVSTCDLMIYTGGVSLEWIDDILKNRDDDFLVINMLSLIGSAAVEEELIEGMETDGAEADDGGTAEYDEHVWMSFENAQKTVTAIAEAVSFIDPENQSVYTANAGAYNARLSGMEKEWKERIGSAEKDTVVFADRFPFRYLVDEFGLKYYAAFPGCFAETEAGFQTIIFLAEKVDELGLSTVLVSESADESIARAVVENTASKDAEVAVVNSMQSVTAKQADGISYLSVMEENLRVLEQALV